MRAVDGVSFSVAPGKLMGLVGESGSGKTVSVLSIMRLLPEGARILGGEIIFEGHDLLKLSEPEMRQVRGARIAMIFQEPMTSLNPVFTIGSQIGEAVRLHQQTSRRDARAHDRGAQAGRDRRSGTPHRRLSASVVRRDAPAGDDRDGAGVQPRLLIADEPTTALDVTIQAQILDLIRDLQVRLGLAVILVTHDLGIVAEYADDVTILYAARVMEQAPTAELFRNPLNPYTRGLLASIPGVDGSRQRRLQAIPGTIPSALNPPSGCRFHPRCPLQIRVRRVDPPLEAKAPDHYVACIRV